MAQEDEGLSLGGILTVGRGAELAVRLNIRQAVQIFLRHQGSQRQTTQLIFISIQGVSPSNVSFIYQW